MPTTGADLARMTDEEIRRLFPGQNCVECGNPIDEFDPLPQKGGSCSDCYFARLGEEVEKHPIYHPRQMRGCGIPPTEDRSCSDSYWEEFSREIEEHPIHLPWRR